MKRGSVTRSLKGGGSTAVLLHSGEETSSAKQETHKLGEKGMRKAAPDKGPLQKEKWENYLISTISRISAPGELAREILET